MKRGWILGVGLLGLTIATQPLWAADPVRGKTLHDKGCVTGCHAARGKGDETALYQRERRKDSLEKLQAQVSFCNQQVLKSEWFPEDEADVVAYLNATFYHFK